MTIRLSEDLERLLDRTVASGRFASREEAVAHAVRLLGEEGRPSRSSREERVAAIADMREIASRNTLGPELTVRELIDEGRRY